MRNVVIRSRADGIVELTPRLVPLEPGDRLMVIVTVLLVTGGLFLCGAIPAAVGGAVAASCVVGEVVLGLKAAALALLRPVAQVLEVPHLGRRRGR
jgi:hypothetical protein